MEQDIRWKQRFDNYTRALSALRDAVILSKERKLSDLEKQGLIQGFEFTYEMAWNVLKDYLEYDGISGLIGPRSVIREAFRRELIAQGEDWMEMIKARNETSHTYDPVIADKVTRNIIECFYPAFINLENKLLAFL